MSEIPELSNCPLCGGEPQIITSRDGDELKGCLTGENSARVICSNSFCDLKAPVRPTPGVAKCGWEAICVALSR